MAGLIENVCVAALYVTPSGKFTGTFTTLNVVLSSTSLAFVRALIETTLPASVADEVSTELITGASFVPVMLIVITPLAVPSWLVTVRLWLTT